MHTSPPWSTNRGQCSPARQLKLACRTTRRRCALDWSCLHGSWHKIPGALMAGTLLRRLHAKDSSALSWLNRLSLWRLMAPLKPYLEQTPLLSASPQLTVQIPLSLTWPLLLLPGEWLSSNVNCYSYQKIELCNLTVNSACR